MREKVYKIARILSIIFVADGIFMVWPLAKGGYAWLTYGQLSYLPVFAPAFLVGVVISAMYAYGVARRSWTLRRTERLFLALFVLAVGAKVAVFIKGTRDDQRGAAQDAVSEHRLRQGVSDRCGRDRAPMEIEGSPGQGVAVGARRA